MPPESPIRPELHPESKLLLIGLPAWLVLLAFVFANVEIQIEGANGWATALPTWRIETGWWLDLLWGGRPMTGYHAWIFAFMALAFHLPVFLAGRYSLRLEARILGSLMVFWIVEDFLWFLLNPAFGLARFNPGSVPWHKHWILGMPVDYPVSLTLGLLLLVCSFDWRSRLSPVISVHPPETP